MNNIRRKQLAKAVEKINEAIQYVTDVLEEESERGETMQECIDALESMVSDFEDYVTQLEEM